MKYNKKDFIKYFRKTAKIGKSEAIQIYNWFLYSLREFLSEMKPGDILTIRGVGTFKMHLYRGRTNCRNPRTGESAVMSARRRLTFTPTTILKRRLKKL